MEGIDSHDVKSEPAIPLNSEAPNVAVIAIHGLGQHLSEASADAVSTLLLSIGRSGHGKQTPDLQPAPPYSGNTALRLGCSQSGFILGWIAMKFDLLRPGAFPLAIGLYVANLFLFLFFLLPDAASPPAVGQNPVATSSLWAVQWIFGELLVYWVLCLLCAFIGWQLGAF